MRKPRINVRVIGDDGKTWLVEDETGRRAFVRTTQIEGTGLPTTFSVPADSFDN